MKTSKLNTDSLQDLSQNELDNLLLNSIKQNDLDSVKVLHQNHANLMASDGVAFKLATKANSMEIIDYLLDNCKKTTI